MSEMYFTLWSKEYCRWIKKCNDNGPLEVIFGGPHTSLPSIRKIKIGDTIIPVCIDNGQLFLISSLTVENILSPEIYLFSRFNIKKPEKDLWDMYFIENKEIVTKLVHRIPKTCADIAVIGGNGLAINFSRKIPDKLLPKLLFGPKGKEKQLSGINEEGKILKVFSLKGHIRRLNQESQKVIIELLNK